MLVAVTMVPLFVAAMALVVLAPPGHAEPASGSFHDLNRWPAEVVKVDLERGTILGVRLGASEDKMQDAFKKAGIRDVKKVSYPNSFLLQSTDCLGMTFNFTDGRLSHVYANSPRFQLPHGLTPGSKMDDFVKALGAAKSEKPLPSKVGDLVVFQSGACDVEVVRLYETPGIGHAVTVRKR